MRTRKINEVFGEEARLKLRLAVFSPAIQAEAAAVIADPLQAKSWGKTVESALTALYERVHKVCENDADLITPSVRALEAVQAGLEAVMADRFNDAAHAGLGKAVGALTATAEPLQQAYRDILLFHRRKPVLAKDLDDYIKAAAFLPRSQEMYDRLGYLSGLAKGLEIYSNQVARHARAEDIRQAMKHMGPLLKTLPQECRGLLENFSRDQNALKNGLPEPVRVGRPLRFRA